MHDAKQWLLGLLDEAFDGPAWHGPSLSSTVRGFSARQAAWRPTRGRRSAWEIVLHCAYWKHRVHERVAPGTATPFPRTGKNWPCLPAEPSPARWRSDVALLKRVHAELREAVASLPAAVLQRPAPRQKQTRRANLIGICYHDIYHAGQIRLLRRILQDESAGHEVAPRMTSQRQPSQNSRSLSGTSRRSSVAREATVNARATGGAA